MLTLLTIGGALILCIVCTVLVRWCAAGKQCQSNISSLSLKTVIITGANNGIGKETAIGLSKRKARVILACRNVSKGKKAAVEVKKRSGNDNVFFMQLDLASLDSIRYFVSTFLEKEPHLDILVNNARATFTKGGSTRTKDGFEIKMGVNHLGHFLLTNLLVNRMKESRSARIVIVSSNAYQCCSSFDFENMNNDDPARYQREHNDAYRQSKLANILFNRELSKRLNGTSVTVNAVHPGTVTTRALDEYIGTFPLISRVCNNVELVCTCLC